MFPILKKTMFPYGKELRISICVAKNTLSPAAAKAGVPPTWYWLSEAGWVRAIQTLLWNVSWENEWSMSRQGGWKPETDVSHLCEAPRTILSQLPSPLLLPVPSDCGTEHSLISPLKAGLWSKHLTLCEVLKCLWFLFLFYPHPQPNWLPRSSVLLLLTQMYINSVPSTRHPFLLPNSSLPL